MMDNRQRLGLLLLGLLAITGLPTVRADQSDPATNRGMRMDYGPFMTYSVLKPGAAAAALQPATKPVAKTATNKGTKTATKPKKPKEGDPSYPWKPEEMLATKGISVKLGHDTTVLFDTDTCRYAAGWTGGFLDLTKCNMGLDKGSLPAFAMGTLQFTTKEGPGWAKDGSFTDPRQDHRGPLPRDWARFKGVYRDGDQLVFSYTVGEVNVLDMPSTKSDEHGTWFVRTLRIDPTSKPLSLTIFDSPASSAVVVGAQTRGQATFDAAGGGHTVVIPVSAVASVLSIAYAPGSSESGSGNSTLIAISKTDQDPASHTHGGPALWKDPIVTGGTLGSDGQPYTVDSIGVPLENPWNSWMRITALDFFSDGRAAVTTWNGDVWIVSNIDAKLTKPTWKRFAAGLYEPLGLRIVDDIIYVNCRDALYRLHDLNGDGEADFYECFNNDAVCSGNYHAFTFDLQTDRDGNFYYTTAGNGEALTTKDHGVLLKISKDGSKMEQIASGLRAANGMGIGPNDEVVIGDNQGNWTPSSKINWVKSGGFYGFNGDPRKYTNADFEYAIGMHPKYDDPLCWIPYGWDNSSAGQLWVTGNKWGPLSGQMLHLSYGKATMFEVMYENVDGVMQGGVVQLPLQFESGLMRARMNPVDGQVYVVGLHGWQTGGGKSACFQRVRYTGKPVHLPNELHITGKGIVIGFTCPLDPETANDPESYSVEQFVYHWERTYGSPEFKASSPDEKGHDELKIKSAKLQPDKRSVLLEIDDLKRVDQMVIKLNLDAADGAKIKAEIGNTINKVGR